jgi:hypothetical protein
VNRIPPEILGYILFFCQPVGWQSERSYFETFLQLTSVCHHWKTIADTTPLLWTNVPGHNMQATKHILERAGEAPLTVDRSWESEREDELMHLLSDYLPRIRFLSFYASEEMWPNVLLVFMQPAPVLEELVIHRGVQYDHPMLSIPATLFSAQAPNLRRLSLTNVSMSLDWAPLRQIRTLCVSCPGTRFRARDLLETLSELPELRYLKLESAILPDSLDQAISTDVELRRLADLEVVDAGPILLYLANHMRARAIDRIQLSCVLHNFRSDAIEVEAMLHSVIVGAFLSRWGHGIRIADIESDTLGGSDLAFHSPVPDTFFFELSCEEDAPRWRKITGRRDTDSAPRLDLRLPLASDVGDQTLIEACQAALNIMEKLNLRSLLLMTGGHAALDRSIWASLALATHSLKDLTVTTPWAVSLLGVMGDSCEAEGQEFSNTQSASANGHTLLLNNLSRLAFNNVDFGRRSNGTRLADLLIDQLRRRSTRGLLLHSLALDVASHNFTMADFEQIKTNGWAEDVIWAAGLRNSDIEHDPWDEYCECPECLSDTDSDRYRMQADLFW